MTDVTQPSLRVSTNEKIDFEITIPPAKPGIFKILSRSKRLNRVDYAAPTLCATSTVAPYLKIGKLG